jgi:Spy/CpxP family protein refolding chaperone
MNCYIVSKAYTTLFLCALCSVLALSSTFARAANVSAATSTPKPVTAQSVTPATQPALSPAYRAKIAQIEKQHQQAVKQLQPLLAARRAALNKLISDPQASESAIRAALSQYMAAQSELYLADIHAQRAEALVYQAAAKAPKTPAVPNPTACINGGCGGASCGGGCGCGCGK